MTPADKRFVIRKNYFIKKAYQAKFIIAFVLLLLVEALLIASLFMHMSGETLTTGYSGSHFIIERTSTFFVISFAIIVFVVATAMALAGVLLFIFLSHRIAGPLYRFEKTLEELSKGNLASRINLRKTDQLAKLQDTFNAALTSLDAHIKEIKKELDKAGALASEPDFEKHASEIKEIISRIKEKSAFFKTS